MASSSEKMDTVDAAPQIPNLPPIASKALSTGKKSEKRRICIPSHRYRPLLDNFPKIYQPVVDVLKLDIRVNLRTRHVEVKTSKHTTDIGALQKGCDFIKAFLLGFEVDDALALVRLDDMYLESFEVTDVKPLKGSHLGRAIGRIAGVNGKTKFTIENVTTTRIILADSKIHLLGSYQRIRIARTAISNLIMGSPPSKVFGTMRAVAQRSAERF